MNELILVDIIVGIEDIVEQQREEDACLLHHLYAQQGLKAEENQSESECVEVTVDWNGLLLIA